LAQQVSDHLEVHIPPLQLYTAGCLEEVADNCLEEIAKSAPKTNVMSNHGNQNGKPCNWASSTQESVDNFESELISDEELAAAIEPTQSRVFLITILQIVGLLLIAAVLLIPAATIYLELLDLVTAYDGPILKSFLAVVLVPSAWMLYIGLIGLTICALTRILQPNYAVQSAVSLWSTRYVRWWTVYRLQDFASKSLAVHLRGTVLLVWWYRLMGAQIGDNVYMDSTDITDPSLLYIGNGAVIEEDATLQSHDVRTGAVRFGAIKVGSRCVVGSFSVIQKGTTMEAGSKIETLCTTHPGQLLQPQRQSKSQVWVKFNSEVFLEEAIRNTARFVQQIHLCMEGSELKYDYLMLLR
jgi:hypothetical protein